MTGHPEPAVIAGYAAGDPAVDDVTAWSVEAHLDLCASCRAVLADAAAPDRPLLFRVAATVGTRIDAAAAAGADAAPARSRLRRLLTGRDRAAWAVVPWVCTAAGMLGVALAFDQASPGAPSAVLLLAPVAPLLPVAAAWSRATDPGWELLSSSPRAGLGMLLRRTLAALLALLPVLVIAGRGHSPALWLLPGLAFTAGSLALGGVLGVGRAAALLAGGWAVGVIVPSLTAGRLPAVLAPGAWWLWALTTVLLAAVAAARRDDHRRLGSRR